MFVRWKRRKRHNRRPWSAAAREGDSLGAYIVTSVREGKRVRQKVLCYLGSVHENTLNEQRNRVFFWKYALPRLNGLGLDVTEREKIEASLNETVPQVVGDELAECEAKQRQQLKAFEATISQWRRSA